MSGSWWCPKCRNICRNVEGAALRCFEDHGVCSNCWWPVEQRDHRPVVDGRRVPLTDGGQRGKAGWRDKWHPEWS